MDKFKIAHDTHDRKEDEMGELNLIGEEFIFGALSTRRALRDCVNAIFKAKGDRKVLREILKSNKSDFDKMVELMDTFKGV